MWKTIGQNYDDPALRGVQFLLAALTVGSSLGLTARFKRHFIAVERVIGAPGFDPSHVHHRRRSEDISVAAANLPGLVDRALNRKRNAERKTIFGASPPLAPAALSLPAGTNRPNRSRPATAEFGAQPLPMCRSGYR